MSTYNKPAISVRQQIRQLEGRGMIIGDRKLAARTLSFINYYRFGGYALAFEIFASGQRTHNFQPGTTFETVLNVYHFDRSLRMILMEAIERLEIAIRSVITSEGALFYKDPHWFLNHSRFLDRKTYTQFMVDCHRQFGKSQEVFVNHYRNAYTDPHLPPAWLIAEIMTLGTWSFTYKNLSDRVLKDRIASRFDLPTDIFEKNLHVLHVTRNLCAHHSRVWNRIFAFKPVLKQGSVQIPIPANDKFAAQVGFIWRMLKRADIGSQWPKKIHGLIQAYGINESELGFSAGWQSHPFWS